MKQAGTNDTSGNVMSAANASGKTSAALSEGSRELSSQMLISRLNETIQAKLTVGAPDDIYEKEADAIAEKVMRMPDEKGKFSHLGRNITSLQRKCAPCQEEEHIHRKINGYESVEFLQMKGTQEAGVNDHISDRINATKGDGSAIPTSSRDFMENRFGVSFSDVRIHTGDYAVQMSRDLNAQAFTVGKDIYFNQNKYAPETSSGKQLLAHELTHTLQQSTTIDRKIQRACGSAEIGVQTDCRENSMVVPERPRYLFEVNCDTFLIGNELDLRIDAADIRHGERVEIHGLASEEGTFEFNRNLSCARALRARAVIQDVLTSRGVFATLVVFSHGPQTGDRPINRSVAVIRHRRPVPPPEPEPEPEPVPPGTPQCDGNYSDGRDETTDGDHDLDKDHHSGENSPDIFIYDNVLGEDLAWSDYYLGYFAGTTFESTDDDNRLYEHFMTGDGSRINFGTSSDMAGIMAGSSIFRTFADGFELAIAAHIAANDTLCGFDGDTYLASNRPGYFSSPVFMYAVMGGYARMEARVRRLPSGDVSITYKFFDHYGAGVSDAWSYLPGLSALYYLQHFHGSWGSQYTPYIWSLEVAETFDPASVAASSGGTGGTGGSGSDGGSAPPPEARGGSGRRW